MTDTTPAPLWRRLLAELLGTGLLVAIVVGSGIAAEKLSPGDIGLQLLENSIATTLGLAVLILVFQTVSGAHFNPIVTLADRVLADRVLADRVLAGRVQTGRLSLAEVVGYLAVQFVGAVTGALLANAMFGLAPAISGKDRLDAGHLLAEVVATAGLVLVIFALVRTGRAAIVAPAVGAYIGAAYWFTSSTSFANPAVTLGRVFSESFAGIAPLSALGFVGAQLIGGALGLGLVLLLFPRKATA